MNYQQKRNKEREESERDAWKNYHERLEAWKNGTLPMPPQNPVRYPFL